MRTTKKMDPGPPDGDAAIATPSSQLIFGGTIDVISLAISRKKQVSLRQRSQRRCKTVTGPLPGLEEMWKSSPSFILDLDKSSEQALRIFASLAYKIIQLCPPRELSYCSDAYDQSDVIQDIIVHFINRNAAVLRSYQDIGKPFVYWFNHIVKNKAIELMRAHKKSTRLDIDEEADIVDTSDDALMKLLKDEKREVLLRALADMALECQVLILAHFNGYSGKQIAILHRLVPTMENAKKLDDRVLYCRRKLVDNASVLLKASRKGKNADSNVRKEI